MNAYQIYEYLNQLYPFDSQDEWDNSVYYIFNQLPIKNILVCLDITSNVLKIALKHNVDLIISHHPFLIKNINSSNQHTKQLLDQIINYQINVITIHTPFDKSPYGMNVNLANQLGLSNLYFGEDSYSIIGNLNQPIELKSLAMFAKNQFNSDICFYLKRFENLIVNRVAICGGSAFSSIYTLNKNNYDVFITCDLKHHNWIDSIELDIPIICLNHNIENVFVDVIVYYLSNYLNSDANYIKVKTKLKLENV